MAKDSVQIGPYRGTPVADGGFASVYCVDHSSVGHPVAVKWSRPDATPEVIASFSSEIAVLGELSHPRIPRLFGFGWCDDRPYLVTDWISGRSLWSDTQSPATDDILCVLRQIAGLLDFLHHRGWVHGDIKPENFLWGSRLTYNIGEQPVEPPRTDLYLIDFGLARRSTDRDRPRGAGTIGYTAPEFLDRRPADGRADWYSVGCMLYEWVFGRRPFAADNPADEISAHLEQPPDFAAAMIRDVPVWVIDLTQRLLQKSADDRADDPGTIPEWIAEHDPDFDLIATRQSNLMHHWESANRRLHPSEHELLEEIEWSARSGNPRRWTVTVDRARSTALATGLTQRFHACKKPVSVVVDTDSQINPDSRVNLPLIDSAMDTAATDIVLRSLVSTSNDDQESPCDLCCLPWSPDGVRQYLTEIAGPIMADQWSPSIFAITDGVPSALTHLVAFLLRRGYFNYDGSDYQIDAAGLDRWQQSIEALAAFDDVIGDLGADERRLCDWFAVGRGLAQTDVLLAIAGIPAERVGPALHSLKRRGVIVPRPGTDGNTFFDWRLRLPAIAALWRTHMPARMRRQHALTLATVLESCSATGDGRVLGVLAECFAEAGSYEKSVHYCTRVCTEHLKANRQDAARPYIDLAERAAAQLPPGKAQAHWLGRARMARGDYEKACGQLDDARRTYIELLSLGRRYGDRQLLAETLKDLSSLYKMTRRFEKGTWAARRALQLFEQLGDRNEVARTLNNLGNMYWVASDRASARKYYHAALDIAKQFDDDRLEALILSNLGATYWGDHDFRRAESYYRQSLVLRERIEEPVETAGTLNNLGVLAMDQGQLAEADQHLRRAINLNLSVGAEAEAVFNRGNLMQVALERGDLRTVISEGEIALRDSDLLGDVATAAEVGGLLAEAYLRAGDFRLARHYLDDATQRAHGQKNNDLSAHLGLIDAMASFCLRQVDATAQSIERIHAHLASAAMPRLYLDAVLLKLRVAVAQQNYDIADRIWLEGCGESRAISAPHKEAQMCLARLGDDPSAPHPDEAVQFVRRFLTGSDEWSWAPSFRIWCSLKSLQEGDLESAETHAAWAIERLRIHGNWETLWKALVVYGLTFHARSDYEPALTALTEAAHILEEIGSTIDDPTQRAMYLSHPLVGRCHELRERILELVS
ncbi:MAG: hypothetical protein Kow0074_21740 [Candidatus Zixiibacteriota bacterium]